ncbi:MAG TPA: DinB family protein [Longimicrobiales bacterium]|nr:DinB family protein [Longimicrobiales bacterium]
MDLEPLAGRLRANAKIFDALIRHVEPEQARWKPAPDQWSIQEVTAHLAEEEVLDFRTRLDLTLHHPGTEWPRIDPQRWVTERGYNAWDPEDTLDRFLAERSRSLAWLEEIPAPDWERAYQHPRFGAIRAGELMTSWVAHDLIHLRQLTRLHRQYLVDVVSPWSAAYAGNW